jgi:hypothetical protein
MFFWMSYVFMFMFSRFYLPLVLFCSYIFFSYFMIFILVCLVSPCLDGTLHLDTSHTHPTPRMWKPTWVDPRLHPSIDSHRLRHATLLSTFASLKQRKYFEYTVKTPLQHVQSRSTFETSRCNSCNIQKKTDETLETCF